MLFLSSLDRIGKKSFVASLAIVLAAAFFASGFFALSATAQQQNITVITPEEGDLWRGTQTIQWSDASDASPYNIFYSSDFDEFQNLVSNVPETKFDWDTVAIDDGEYKIRVFNNDGEQRTSGIFTIDNTVPETALEIDPAAPDGDNGWYVTAPTITLSCADNLSGCSGTFYQWNDASDPNSFTQFTDPIAPPEDGEHTLFFYSEDNAVDNDGNRNRENVQSFDVKVDTALPEILSYTLNGEEVDAFFNPNAPASVEIVLNASEPVKFNIIRIQDSASAIVKSFTQIGSFEISATKTWDGKDKDTEGSVVPDGMYHLKTKIVDRAGNESDTLLSPHTMVVDTQDPTIADFNEPQADTVYKSTSAGGLPIPIVFTLSDPAPGTPLQCGYVVNGGDPVANDACESGVAFSGVVGEGDLTDGRNDVSAYGTDSAGNSFISDPVSIVFDSDDTLRVPTDFGTIQEAIDKADEGDTIEVGNPSVYGEDLMITTNGLTLQGVGKPTIKGVAVEPVANWPLATPNIEIQANNVTIANFVIESPEIANGFYSSGIVLTGTGIEISDNDFVFDGTASHDSRAVGIQTYRVNVMPESDISGLLIENNTFSGEIGERGFYGAFINRDSGGGGITIQNNEFAGRMRAGIQVERSNAIIAGNTFDGSGFPGESINGMWLFDWDSSRLQENVEVKDNTLTGFSAVGITAGFEDQPLINFVLKENTIENSETGVLVQSSAAGVALSDNNAFSGNGTAARNDDSEPVNAVNNWWGSASGPSHASNTFTAPSGEPQGDAVSDGVAFVSWCSSTSFEADCDFAPVTIGNPAQFSSIRAAVDAAEPGDTISAVAGVFSESGIVTAVEGISILGDPGAIVRAPAGCVSEFPSAVFHLHSDNVTLSGFEVDGGDTCLHGIHIGDLSEIQVAGVEVSGNNVHGAQAGVTLSWGSSYDPEAPNVVSANDIHENSVGVFIDSAYWNRVEDNRIHDNITGIGIEGSGDGNTANFNSITGNIGGVQNNTGTEFRAERNWWGSERGPFHDDTSLLGEGDSVSDNVDFSPWCTNEECAEFGSLGPLAKLLLMFVPNPVGIPNESVLTVTAVDEEDITLVNDTRQVELNGGGTTKFDGVSGPALINLVDGALTTDVTETTPGTVNVVAKILGVPFGQGAVTFEGEPLEPFIVDDVIIVSDTGAPTGLFVDGWRHTFFLTINATDETDLWVRFEDWLNVADEGITPISANSNMRVLFNTATGGDFPVGVGGLTEDDIVNGFGDVVSFEIGNDFDDQKVGAALTPIDTAGLDTNASLLGRQVRTHIFTRIPEGTATGFYETEYEIRLGNE